MVLSPLALQNRWRYVFIIAMKRFDKFPVKPSFGKTCQACLQLLAI